MWKFFREVVLVVLSSFALVMMIYGSCKLAIEHRMKDTSIQANVYQLATDKGLKALKCHPSIHTGVVLCQMR